MDMHGSPSVITPHAECSQKFPKFPTKDCLPQTLTGVSFPCKNFFRQLFFFFSGLYYVESISIFANPDKRSMHHEFAR